MRKGFTLVELMMCVAIMLLMTGALLQKYPETTMRMNVSNTAHKLALLVREAQIRGSAVDSVNSTLGGYGMYFDLANNKEAILFGDTIDSSISKPFGLGVGNGIYDGLVVDKKKSSITMPIGYSFKKLCIKAATSYVCNDDYSPHITNLTISFSRPSTFANIYINGDPLTEYSSACVEVNSPKAPLSGHVRSVQFYHSGMVTTSNGPCQ